MARPQSPDPARDLLGLIGEQARRHATRTAPRLEVGEVVSMDDPDLGIVVDLDNMTEFATECLILDHVIVSEGDRVLVLFQREEFFIIGVLASADA